MNILFLADILPYPPNTGIKIRTYNIVKQLSKRNNVYMVCFNHAKLFASNEAFIEAKEELGKLCKELHVLPIPSDKNKATYYWTLLKNVVSPNPYRVERYWSQECVSILSHINKKVPIDLFHFDKVELCDYRKYITHALCSITNHNVESKLMKSRLKYEITFLRKAFAYLQYRKTQKYEIKNLNDTSVYMTCTKDDLFYFKNKLKIRSAGCVIENGVDTNKYTSEYYEDSDYFLIIGAQSREATANYDATIYFLKYIWPLVIKERPSCKLKIVGRDPDRTITKYNQKMSVQVVGFVQDERAVLGQSIALIVPLRIGGGSRLKIITSMAMGKPVISTTVGAEGIECTNHRDILITDTHESFAQVVIDCYDNELLRQKIGKNAAILAKTKYDWDVIGSKLNNLYEGLLANG